MATKDKKIRSSLFSFWKKKEDLAKDKCKSCENICSEIDNQKKDISVWKRRWPSLKRSKSQTLSSDRNKKALSLNNNTSCTDLDIKKDDVQLTSSSKDASVKGLENAREWSRGRASKAPRMRPMSMIDTNQQWATYQHSFLLLHNKPHTISESKESVHSTEKVHLNGNGNIASVGGNEKLEQSQVQSVKGAKAETDVNLGKVFSNNKSTEEATNHADQPWENVTCNTETKSICGDALIREEQKKHNSDCIVGDHRQNTDRSISKNINCQARPGDYVAGDVCKDSQSNQQAVINGVSHLREHNTTSKAAYVVTRQTLNVFLESNVSDQELDRELKPRHGDISLANEQRHNVRGTYKLSENHTAIGYARFHSNSNANESTSSESVTQTQRTEERQRKEDYKTNLGTGSGTQKYGANALECDGRSPIGLGDDTCPRSSRRVTPSAALNNNCSVGEGVKQASSHDNLIARPFKNTPLTLFTPNQASDTCASNKNENVDSTRDSLGDSGIVSLRKSRLARTMDTPCYRHSVDLSRLSVFQRTSPTDLQSPQSSMSNSWYHRSFRNMLDFSSASHDSGVSQVGRPPGRKSSHGNKRVVSPDVGISTGIETDTWDSSDVSPVYGSYHHKSMPYLARPGSTPLSSPCSEEPIPEHPHQTVINHRTSRSKSQHDLSSRRSRRKSKNRSLHSKSHSQHDIRDRENKHLDNPTARSRQIVTNPPRINTPKSVESFASYCKSQDSLCGSIASDLDDQDCNMDKSTCPIHGHDAVFAGQPHVHFRRSKSLEIVSPTKHMKKQLKASKNVDAGLDVRWDVEAPNHVYASVADISLDRNKRSSLSDRSRTRSRDPVYNDAYGYQSNRWSIKESESLYGTVEPLNTPVSMAAESTFYHGATLADKLRTAASEGDPNKVADYLNQGADFEPDREGRTAIHYAALNGYHNVVSLLTNAGCDIDAQDRLGYTALHRAAAQGHLDVIHALLEEGCVLDRQDDVHGNAALHEAAWNGYSHTLEVLIKNKATVNILNKAGFTALHLAAQNGHNQSARVLLYGGCDSNLKNNYGDTALHTSVRYGHAGVTRILVSAKCRIDELNKNGDTSLHIAAALKRRKIAKLLTEAGININIKNKQGETAADVAKRKQFHDIVDTIMAQPAMLKNKKKLRKKSGKSNEKADDKKLMMQLPEEGEKKEKKGFFFKMKSKSKKQLKEGPPSGSSIEVKEDEEDIKPCHHSDLSSRSSEFSNLTPQEIARLKAEGFKPPPPPSSRLQARGTSTGPSQNRASHAAVPAKHGYLSQYVPKEGKQYYKDLAGNVKEGPIGYTPVCTCAPALKKLEAKMEADRDNIYDHIGYTHKMLTEQINKMDQRCAQQVINIDKITRERLDKERTERDGWLSDRLLRERQDWNSEWEKRHRYLRNETRFNVDMKMTAFEKKYGHKYCEGCDWCRREKRGNNGGNAPVDDDCVRYTQHGDAPESGALTRCYSDETLSVSSSHPSRRNWKVRSRAMKELKDINLAKVRHGALKIESELRASKRCSPPGAANIYQEIPLRRPTGRSPEGQSQEDKDFIESTEARQDVYGTWGKRLPINNGFSREFEEPDGKAYLPQPIINTFTNGMQGLQVHDKPKHQRHLGNPVQTVGEGVSSTTKTFPTDRPVKHTQVVSVGAVPSEVHFTSPTNTPTSSLDARSPNFDTSGSSLNIDSPGGFSYFGSPTNVRPTHNGNHNGSQNSETKDNVVNGNNNHIQGSAVPNNQFYRSVLSNWYEMKAQPMPASGHSVRAAQAPPLGYGHQPQKVNGATVYKAPVPTLIRQQPQPQVPVQQQQQQEDAQVYVSGKATQV